jgi:hypothetical protein
MHNISGLDKTNSQRYFHRLDTPPLRSNNKLHCCTVRQKCYLLSNRLILQASNKINSLTNCVQEPRVKSNVARREVVDSFGRTLPKDWIGNTKNYKKTQIQGDHTSISINHSSSTKSCLRSRVTELQTSCSVKMAGGQQLKSQIEQLKSLVYRYGTLKCTKTKSSRFPQRIKVYTKGMKNPRCLGRLLIN